MLGLLAVIAVCVLALSMLLLAVGAFVQSRRDRRADAKAIAAANLLTAQSTRWSGEGGE